LDFLAEALQEAEGTPTLRETGATRPGSVGTGAAPLRPGFIGQARPGSVSEETAAFCARIRDYVARIRQTGYVPRAVHFAVARYHDWLGQVPDATFHARAAQLRELLNSYRIEEVARRFPAARLSLYAQTVLRDLPDAQRAVIDQAVRRLADGAEIKDVLGRLYADLQAQLPSHDLRYFLTRAVYPHLDPDEKAELVTISQAGPDGVGVAAERAELVTEHIDRTGRTIRIRTVASAREVDTLHRVFYAAGMGGGLTASDQLLVAVDEAGYVVGGVAYVRRTPTHVLLDRVAVLHRCRNRGIGRLLMQEFLRRLEPEGVGIVSAQLIRHHWLEQFGFRSHPRYAGVVLALGQNTAPGA